MINPNDTQTLHFYNDPVGGVEIIKVNEDNHSERIPNTTFEIRKVDDALVDTVTTDKNGRVFVALEDGSYYAKEVTSNKSFRLDDTPHYFEIKDGKRVTLQVTNKKLSGIVIHKIDSATGEGIYGVKFVLYDANKKPIGEYTSDDEGYIYIDEIPGGLSGRFYLRELEAAPGYTLDKQYKTSMSLRAKPWRLSGKIPLSRARSRFISTPLSITRSPAPLQVLRSRALFMRSSMSAAAR